MNSMHWGYWVPAGIGLLVGMYLSADFLKAASCFQAISRCSIGNYMTHDFEKGFESAVLHFLFGALFGAVLVFCLVFWFLSRPAFDYAILGGAAFFGVVAALWRNRFWKAIANNPLFVLWRVLTGAR